MADRLFFAIFPDADAAERAAHLAQRLRDGYRVSGHLVESPRLHVTLLHLGHYEGLPPRIVTAASKAAASVAMPPFDLVFDRAMSFAGQPDRRPLVLLGSDGIDTLTALCRSLTAAMTTAGLGRRMAPRYTPHMTMLYGDGELAEQAVETIAWTVREFVLVHSVNRDRKVLYVPLGRWPLRAELPGAAITKH
ncbi:MAG: 2'-5' RNA ligase family protein [Dongiaceae bacterium]